MSFFTLLLVFSLLTIASAYDLKYYRIPNNITYPAILIGLAYNTFTSGFEGFQFSLIGALAGIGFFILPYLSGKMGAGDAKLLGAIGSFVGTKAVFIIFFYTTIIGGIYALLILFLYNEKFKGFFTNFYYSCVNLMVTRKYVSFEDNEISRQRPMLCYGLAIAAGTGIFIIFELAKIKVLPF